MSRRLGRTVAGGLAVVLLSSCATEIVGPLDSTVPDAPVTTLPAPLPIDIEGLLEELVKVSTGLGDIIAAGDKNEARSRLARAEALWQSLQPLIIESGVDLLDETGSVVALVRTAVQRTRPADGDKALRFAVLLRDSAAELL